jgi:pilus assembly protein Flp/PilA
MKGITNPSGEETQMRKLRRFLKDETGVTALEYALLAGLIAGVIVGTVTTLGTSVEKAFQTLSAYLAAAA